MVFELINMANKRYQKVMLVVLALCATYTAFAQNACHPFACEGKVWHYWSEANEDYSYTLIGDTVVGDITMKKLFLTDRKAYGDDKPRYVGAIHEDGGRVSFFPDGTAEGKTAPTVLWRDSSTS